MNQALYAHMNNKRKMEKKNHEQQRVLKSDFQPHNLYLSSDTL
jgi:hypothetical protein